MAQIGQLACLQAHDKNKTGIYITVFFTRADAEKKCFLR